MAFCSQRRARLLWQFSFGVSFFFLFSFKIQMILTSSGVSVDGYFQSWLHCCEIWTDSREPRGFENNSNFLLLEVDGWHFCFVCEISDLTFSWSLTETFTVLWGRTYSLLDLSPRALKWPICSWCSDDSLRVRDGWVGVWMSMSPENDNFIHCELSRSFSTCWMAKITYPLWLFSVDELKMFSVFFYFPEEHATSWCVVVNSDFGGRSILPWKNSSKPFLQILSQWILKGIALIVFITLSFFSYLRIAWLLQSFLLCGFFLPWEQMIVQF